MKKTENIILIIAGGFLLFFIIQILSQTGISWFVDFRIASNWASSFSGVLAFFSFLLIYFSLKYQQRSFNWSIIENKFYELIKIHRENVNIMKHDDPASTNSDKIETVSGVRVFMSLFNEFNTAFYYLESRINSSMSVKDIYQDINQKADDSDKIANNHLDIDLKTLCKIDIAYLILYYGVTYQGKKILEKTLKRKYNHNLVDNIVDYYTRMPVKWSQFSKEFYYNNYVSDGKKFDKFFSGHQNRLGHYFRHMYQMVNYIDSRNELDYRQKYEFIKTYRAQFSTYEQAIIFLNSLSQLGRVWEFNQLDINKKLITKYNLIKNLPIDFIPKISVFDFYPFINYEGEKIDFSKREELEKKYK